MIGYKKISAIAIIAMLLSGCIENKKGAGALIGAATGGLLGSTIGKGEGRMIAIGVGALAGGLVGSSIGKSLDEYDKAILSRKTMDSLEYSPSGRATEWSNPDSGHHGYITPRMAYKDSYTGEYCREYTQVIMVGDTRQTAYGRACRKPDGNWEIMQ